MAHDRAEDMSEMMRRDAEYAAQLQKEYDEEDELNSSRDVNSPGLVGHPPSPIESRLSPLLDGIPDEDFGEQISAQLLQRIGRVSPKSLHLPALSQNVTQFEMEENLAWNVPSSSKFNPLDSDEAYARRLQEEFDKEAATYSPKLPVRADWNPVNEWRTLTGLVDCYNSEEDLQRALKASISGQPSSSKTFLSQQQNDRVGDKVDEGLDITNTRDTFMDYTNADESKPKQD